jgi:two-component system chemotaxis response regulator CheY
MPAGNFAHLKALVVEDNVHMRTLLKSLLKSLDLKEIYEATDGNDGFDELHATRPDFVLSDLNMKPVDGLEFTRRVRNDPASPCRYIPIIMVTGHTERKYIEAARDAGVTEVLAKPITPHNLYTRIVEIIERPRVFVKSDSFFGPDRRRHQDAEYSGPLRRSGDDTCNLQRVELS